MLESRTGFLAIVLCLLPSLAWAHAALIKSVPGPREELRESPALIRLLFNEKVEAQFSTLNLEREDAQPQPLGAPRLAADNPQELQTEVLQPLKPGLYTLRYRVLSQDGHVIERSYRFRIKPAAATP